MNNVKKLLLGFFALSMILPVFSFEITSLNLDWSPTDTIEKYAWDEILVEAYAKWDEDVNYFYIEDESANALVTADSDDIDDLWGVITIDSSWGSSETITVGFEHSWWSSTKTFDINILDSDDPVDSEEDLNLDSLRVIPRDNNVEVLFSCNKEWTAESTLGGFVSPNSWNPIDVLPDQWIELNTDYSDLENVWEGDFILTCKSNWEEVSVDLNEFITGIDMDEPADDIDYSDWDAINYEEEISTGGSKESDSKIDMTGDLNSSVSNWNMSFSWTKPELENQYNFDQYRVYLFEEWKEISFAWYNYLAAIGDYDNISWGWELKNRHGMDLEKWTYDVYVLAYDRHGNYWDYIKTNITISEDNLENSDDWQTVTSRLLLRSSDVSSYKDWKRIFDKRWIIFVQNWIRTVFEKGMEISGINRDDDISQWEKDISEIELSDIWDDAEKIEQRVFFWVEGKSITFSTPLEINIPVSKNGEYKVSSKHHGEDWSSDSLSIAWGACNDWIADSNKSTVNVSNWTATIYTCKASEFILYKDKEIIEKEKRTWWSWVIRSPDLDAIPDEIRSRSTEFEITINWRTIEFLIPQFRNSKDAQLVDLLINEFVNQLKNRWVLGDDLYESVSYLNEFLFYLKMFKDYEVDKSEARENAKESATKFIKILEKYPEIDLPEKIDDLEFEEALTFMYENWLTRYNNVSEFKPYRHLQRQEAAKMFSKFATNVLEKTTDKSRTCEFKDIGKADYTLVQSIIESCYLWLMRWTKWDFWPDVPLTRAEFMTVLVRAIKGDMDESQNPWWAEYWAYAVYTWLSDNRDKTTMWDPITRYESALILYRAYKKE